MSKKTKAIGNQWLTHSMQSKAKRLLAEPHPAHPDWIEDVKGLLQQLVKEKPPITELQLKFVKLATQEIQNARAYAKNCAYHHADTALVRRDVWLNAALILADNQY